MNDVNERLDHLSNHDEDGPFSDFIITIRMAIKKGAVLDADQIDILDGFAGECQRKNTLDTMTALNIATWINSSQ